MMMMRKGGVRREGVWGERKRSGPGREGHRRTRRWDPHGGVQKTKVDVKKPRAGVKKTIKKPTETKWKKAINKQTERNVKKATTKPTEAKVKKIIKESTGQQGSQKSIRRPAGGWAGPARTLERDRARKKAAALAEKKTEEKRAACRKRSYEKNNAHCLAYQKKYNMQRRRKGKGAK